IAIELPLNAHFFNHVEVEIGCDQLVFIARSLRNDLSARIAEITLAVEFADVPWPFFADSVDRADEVTVRNGVSRLLKLPQIFRMAGSRRRRNKDNLCAVESESACAFRKVAIVADIDADFGICGLEHRITEIPRREVELLPKSRQTVRNMRLAILAEILAVGV